MGHRQAEQVLLNSMKRLEYRGYDSSGIAVCGKGLQVFKDKVRVEELQDAAPCIEGNEGIGHTRWATHGEPSRVNAHPHCDCSGNIAVVHNGVINNYQSLKAQLIREGHRFLSETDTEVIAHLIEKYYSGNIEKAVRAALRDLQGSYAIAVVTSYEPTMMVARNGNPLILGMGDNETIVASDIPALLDYTDQVIYLEDGDIATITMQGVKIKGDNGAVTRPVCQIAWNAMDVEKNGYDH
jgi:glutamine---fructose-6-phosphate transaminase (isomerizing)